MVGNQRNVNVEPNQYARHDHANVRPRTPQDPTLARWAQVQFLLMLVSVGRTTLDLRVTRTDETEKRRRSLRVRLLLDHGPATAGQGAAALTHACLCHGHLETAFRLGAAVYVAFLVTFQTFSPLSDLARPYWVPNPYGFLSRALVSLDELAPNYLRIAYRGSFVIDPEGIVRFAVTCPL
jgi:hypothetical protein